MLRETARRPDNLAFWPARYRESERTGQPVRFEYADTIGDRPVWYSATVCHVGTPMGGPPRFSYVVEDATERKQAEEQLRASERRFQMATQATRDVIWDWDLKTGHLWLNEGFSICYGYPPESVRPANDWWADQIHPDDRNTVIQTLQQALDGEGLNWTSEYRFRRFDGTYAPTFDRGLIERDEQGEPVRMIGSMMDVTERRHAEEEIRALNGHLRRRLEQIAALRWIDAAISSGEDLPRVLDVALDQVQTQLGVDAAAVLLLDESGRTLTCVADRGLNGEALRRSIVPVDSSLVGRVVMGLGPLHVADVGHSSETFQRQPIFTAEGIVAYHAVPLVAKGRTKGVLEIYHRAPLEGEPCWRDYLGTLAGQMAIAVESAELRKHLEHSHTVLADAYEATIEGWARRLDLRDHETEGHSRRVTEMTVRLAHAIGFDGPDLVHVRRGALLHDIGKMGIPDAILNKRGPLTDVEWEVMRRHPKLAVDLLWPIAHLRPALEIPFCHHERWDGTGYPRGLAGEAIPLSARIFAAVDIWDALRSDRPYRAAWPEAKVREHLASLSGTHLDPRVVAAFLELLESDATGNGTSWPLGGTTAEIVPYRAWPIPPTPEEPVARTLLEHVGEMVTILEADGTIRWESPSLGRILGFALEEVAGRPAFDWVHPDDLPAAHDVFEATLRHPGAEQTMRARVQHKDGSWRHLEIVGKNLLDDPSVRGLLLTSRDVTEQTRSEEALRRHEALLQAVLDHSPAAVSVKDARGRYLLTSRSCESILGLPQDRAVGLTDDDLFPLELAATRQVHDREVITDGAVCQFEEQIEWPDGPRTLFSVKFPLLDPDGQPFAVGCIATDITDRKGLEARLAEQLRRANELNARLIELAETDALTGLKNRRAFLAAIESARLASSRRGLPLALLLVDLDRFKRFNDTFGHPAGDTALSTVAGLLRRNVRGNDLVARLGGEEFAILLPDTTGRDAAAIAEDLRKAIASHPWAPGSLSASFGVAAADGAETDVTTLIEQADRALYHAKRSGRNRVVLDHLPCSLTSADST